MRCPPQPASAITIDSRHADVIKVLKIFNRVAPAQMDDTLACNPREVSEKMDNQVKALTPQTFILMLETS
ncbi:hypothetical protein CK231_05360 [Mesorhizobium loti]|uniref:Uncharacterized protein n=1 Tax=Rhizobium loti TaxID=381 RepID=A0A1A5I5V7_RHILI|nr:hypothetical protein BAE42_14265 [Mesorhizobium loti]QGX76149.1 hypothetical protein EB234_03765 [Mesorhizobium japonicum R7A]OBP74618.1 hypothetical protein BAE41_13685 [Mesorhizobium loti]OBP82782.1 hypothetical protein BAE39_04360 [Mesorhizobium loti]OBP94588.1 hypothetical protein BAE40_04135 [Mesorhizobium loti]